MTDGAPGWAETRRRLREDAIRLRAFQESKFGYRPVAWFIDPAWEVIVLHRLSALAWHRGHHKLGRLVMQINSLLTGADIHPASDLGPGLLIPTPCGVTLSCKAGRNLTVLALAGIGGSREGRDLGAGPGLPVLGDDVVSGPFSGVQNGIRVGDGVIVEGGGGALKDVPAGARMGLQVAPLIGTAATPPDRPGRPFPVCRHGAWHRTRSDIRADIDRYAGEVSRHGPAGAGLGARLSAFLTNPVLAATLYRLAHWQHANGRVRLAGAITRINLLANRLTITPDSCIGGGLFLPHLGGTLFCGCAGTNLTLYANSLCAPFGPAVESALGAAPILGDNVTVSGHSAILGPLVVGSDIRLAAKVQVMQDLPGDAVVFSPMARVGELRQAPEQPAERHGTPTDGPTAPARWRTAWRTMRERLAQDRIRLAACSSRGTAGFPGLACVRLHRLSHALYTSGHRRGARWAWLLNTVLTGADISPASDLGAGLLIPHPAGICIHASAGSGLTLLAQTGLAPSTIADGRLPALSAAPVAGRDVSLSHHSGIFGAITVGDGVHLTAGCIATRPVAAGVTLVPRPLKLRRMSAERSSPGGDDEAS